MSDRTKSQAIAAGVALAAAITLIVVMGQTWYSWQIPETLGSGDVPAWNAWPGELNHAIIVAGLAAAAALLAVVGVAAARPKMIVAGAVAAFGTVLGAVWLIGDPYTIPVDEQFSTFDVTIQPAAWAGLALAAVLFVATAYAALERPALPGRKAALASAVVLGALLFAAVSAFGHVRTTGRNWFYTSPGPAADQKCGVGEAWVSEGAYNRGKMEADTWAMISFGVYPPRCAALQDGAAPGTNARPANSINVRAVYQVRKNGNWQGCDASNLQYNGPGKPQVQMERNYLQHPCGSNHYYRTVGFHGYKKQNGDWTNGNQSSPDHFFG